MRCVVVGGGFAGLAAALALADRGHAVELLERRPVLGGRAWSYRDPGTGDVVDNGQHVLFGAYRATLRFLERIGASRHLWTQPRLAVHYASSEGETALRASGLPPPFHLATAMLRLGGLSAREKLGILRAVRALGRLDEPALADLDALTVREWLGRLGQGERAQQRFWEPFATAAINERPEAASALWLARVARAVFLGTRADARLVVPAVGLSELYAARARAALEAKGARVTTGATAARVAVSPSGRAEGVELEDGRAVAADAVVLAVPHWSLPALLPPALRERPPFRDVERLGAAPIVTVHLWLDREPTPHPLVGLLGTEMQFLFNMARIRGSRPGHLCLVASAAHALAATRREAIAELALEEVRRLLPGARAARLVRAAALVEHRSTPSLRPGLAPLRPGAATPVPNLALAGDWSDPVYPATIESAVLSGERAARHLAG